MDPDDDAVKIDEFEPTRRSTIMSALLVTPSIGIARGFSASSGLRREGEYTLLYIDACDIQPDLFFRSLPVAHGRYDMATAM